MHIHIHKYTCMYMCVCVCEEEGEGEGREERRVVLGGSVGGWGGEYVLVRVYVVCFVLCCCVFEWLCVVCCVPQDKMELKVKRMIGGLENVLFSTCSQSLNG